VEPFRFDEQTWCCEAASFGYFGSGGTEVRLAGPAEG